ncbi:MAG: BON domain-containing protein [Rhodocyclaceae bacterium]|nr:BON domain-containing protein [Rhodocyclaceae bacterium]
MKHTSSRTGVVAASAVLLAVAGASALRAGPVLGDTMESGAGAQKQESAGQMVDDSAITAKVKSAFVQDDKVSALRIKVTTDKGVVQLSGFANSAQEADRAAEVARKVPGVKDVKNDIMLKK